MLKSNVTHLPGSRVTYQVGSQGSPEHTFIRWLYGMWPYPEQPFEKTTKKRKREKEGKRGRKEGKRKEEEREKDLYNLVA